MYWECNVFRATVNQLNFATLKFRVFFAIFGLLGVFSYKNLFKLYVAAKLNRGQNLTDLLYSIRGWDP